MATMNETKQRKGSKKMNEQTFTYQYSAKQNKEVEHIRNKYLPKKASKLEMLKKLDRKARTAGQWQALTLGIVGCLVFGIGMCFGLAVFGPITWPALPFGLVGVALMAPAYPLYLHISKKTKAALTPRILGLSDEIINASKKTSTDTASSPKN